MNRYGDSFRQICLIKDLVQNFGVDPRVQEKLESRCRGPLFGSKTPGRNSSGPPMWSLMNDIQQQLSNDTWILDPGMYSSWTSLPGGSSIRLSEIVTIMFLHPEYLYQQTNLSSYEIYSLSMLYSHLFFKQISDHFKSGKVHTVPPDSPAATELAIDLGTLFFLVSYGPAHLRNMYRSIEKVGLSATTACFEDKVDTVPLSSENSQVNKKIARYIMSELNRWLGSDGRRWVPGRHLPFKASTLPDRWAFLQDYLSHWMDRIGLRSTDTSAVVSSLVLAYRLCRLDLVDTSGSRGTCQRLIIHRPTPPLNTRMTDNLRYLSSLCQEMQDKWTPQRATETLHGYLADRKVLVWHLISLWELRSRPKQGESHSDLQDLTRLSDMFPPAIRVQVGSARTLDSKLQSLYGLCTDSSEEMDIIKQQWQAISHDLRLPTPIEQEWLGTSDRVRQITVKSFLKRIWT